MATWRIDGRRGYLHHLGVAERLARRIDFRAIAKDLLALQATTELEQKETKVTKRGE